MQTIQKLVAFISTWDTSFDQCIITLDFAKRRTPLRPWLLYNLRLSVEELIQMIQRRSSDPWPNGHRRSSQTLIQDRKQN